MKENILSTGYTVKIIYSAQSFGLREEKEKHDGFRLTKETWDSLSKLAFTASTYSLTQ